MTLYPDIIFETSWEVCNKVGGIYTVLSSKALTMQKERKDGVIFFAPDIWQTTQPFDFEATGELTHWANFVNNNHPEISIRTGRWNIHGQPLVVLVDFEKLYRRKNEIYGEVWANFKVNSLNGYGDYDSSSMFGYACGAAMESYYRFFNLQNKRVVAHFHEWQTAFGLFYIKHNCPDIATLFTTHATTIGRSIAGNNKPLYDNIADYNGDAMAAELNVEAKHSAEKQAAHFADCFTSVSKITAEECRVLLEKHPDIVTPNGFENDFVPKGKTYSAKRERARAELKKIAEKKISYSISDETIFVGISGRYEFKNKGIDVFIETMSQLNNQELDKNIVAFILVPAWVNPQKQSQCRFASLPLMEDANDRIISTIRWHGFTNAATERVKIIFVPVYLNGENGEIALPYYDLLIGFDLTLFPSYYEPWGYTPQESAAFAIPTITTSLSGFGQWVSGGDFENIDNGIAVIPRCDNNYFEVVENIKNQVVNLIVKPQAERQKTGKKAQKIAQNSLWKNFFDFYKEAYQFALGKRVQKKS